MLCRPTAGSDDPPCSASARVFGEAYAVLRLGASRVVAAAMAAGAQRRRFDVIKARTDVSGNVVGDAELASIIARRLDW
jgi:hypothetical protein